MLEPRYTADPPPRWLLAALAVAALLHVAAFAGFVPGNDWTRDLVAAFAIADGEGFPSRGPVINASAHLGPVWYWLLALPLALGAGFTGTVLFVGALATLKVPLAWRLGARLGGPWLALGFAALMLLPGWDLVRSLQLTHTVMLEALLLAAWLPLLTLWRDGHARQWAVFGLLGGLAVHAHPVALALFAPAAAVAWRRRWHWRGDAAWIGAGLVVALLPLLPMLFAEAREGWPGLQALREAADSAAPAEHTTLLQLLAALTAGAWNVLHAWLPPKPTAK